MIKTKRTKKFDVSRVLVCGGRDFTDSILLKKTLNKLKPKLIIHGCAYGADSLANVYAFANNIPQEKYQAEWDKYGRSAGPIRNNKMLKEGKPTVVVAFPGGRGTDHMKSIAREAGIPVIEVEKE